MKTKVSDLKGAELSKWVAKAQGWSYHVHATSNGQADYWNGDVFNTIEDYRPDLNWSQCGELVEEFKRCAPRWDQKDEFWSAKFSYASQNRVLMSFMLGPTPQVAICRAVVASRFGEYVEEEE